MNRRNFTIGIDLDNTIACYDEAIAILAKEMLEIPEGLPRTKIELRNYLRAIGREKEWTAFQGAIYGPGMKFAKPFDGAIRTLEKLVEQGYRLNIVSHRSLRPYAGPSHDLHTAAREWISRNLKTAGLFQSLEENEAKTGSVSLLTTREAKIARIAELGCAAFLDDLPEVLGAPGFPTNTVGILFAPEGQTDVTHSCHTITNWRDLPVLLKRLL